MGLEFRGQVSEFRVHGQGFGVHNLKIGGGVAVFGFRVWGLEYGDCLSWISIFGSQFSSKELGCRVRRSQRAQCFKV